MNVHGKVRLPTAADMHDLLRLAAPIVLVQLGMMSMGVVDTLMVGRVSPIALAAVALGNLFSFGIMVFGIGILVALDPVVSQALGAGDVQAVRRGTQRGLLLAGLIAVPIALAMLGVEPVLRITRQPTDVVPLAAGYVYRLIPAIWPFYAFVVMRQVLQAHRRTRPIVLTILTANAINVVLNYAWIFGHFGFPSMGVLGSAWATLVSRWSLAILLLVCGWGQLRPYLSRLAPGVLSLRPLLRMLAIGLPIGAQMSLELGAFATVAILMGWFGIASVAAHQVAINLASLTFMVPLGVSSAAAVLVGHAVGRGDPDGVRRATVAALLVGAGFMSTTALLLISFPEQLARLYTEDPGVLAVAMLLLPIAGVFQIFDGLQVVSLGLLRGLGDVRVPMLANVLAFWCFGIPVSLWLAFVAGFGATGLWWGLVLGLAIVAVFLLARLRFRERGDLVRIVVDDRLDAAPVTLETLAK